MITLRDYQMQAIDSARALIVKGHKRIVLVSPTGSGKTMAASALVMGAVRKSRRVLWLAHRCELVEQAYDTLTSFNLICGAIGETVARPNRALATVQVAMVQTLRTRKNFPLADIVIYDECHHAPSEEGRFILDQYPNAIVIGLTATPERTDGVGLGCVFDALHVVTTVRHLTDRGVLVPCQVISPSSKLKRDELAQSPIDAYQKHASGRQAIVFAPHTLAAVEFLRSFKAAGIAAEMVTGEDDVGMRKSAIDAFKAGRTQVLVNMMVLTEGFDHPPTSCAILARGCSSPGLYLQIVGRILRTAPDKTDAVLIDLRGVTHVHGTPDEDRIYSLEGKAIRRKGDDVSYCQTCSAIMDEFGHCPNCPSTGTGDGMEMPVIVNAKLAKFASKRKESEPERAACLARWMTDAKKRGFKTGWANWKYNVVYGEWPPRRVTDLARSMTGEVAA